MGILVDFWEYRKRKLAFKLATQFGLREVDSDEVMDFAWKIYRRVQYLGRTPETEHLILEHPDLFWVLYSEENDQG